MDEENFINNGIITFKHPNGQLKSSCRYIGGNKHGTHKEWRYNGQIQTVTEYEHGLRQGNAYSWYSGGNIYKHEIFENDMLHGERIVWFPSGQIISNTFYIEDSFISPTLLKKLTGNNERFTKEDKLLISLKFNIDLCKGVIIMKCGVKVKLREGVMYHDYTDTHDLYDPGHGKIVMLTDLNTAIVQFDKPIPGKKKDAYLDEVHMSDLLDISEEYLLNSRID